MKRIKLMIALFLLSVHPGTAIAQVVLFRSTDVALNTYSEKLQESDGRTPQDYYIQFFKNSQISLEEIDQCQKKLEKEANCQSEIENILQFPLNLEARENLIVLMQDIDNRKKFKKAFFYSTSFLKSLTERKRKVRLSSMRIRGAESLLETGPHLKDTVILRNGKPKKFSEIIWLEDEYSQWTLLTSTRPPLVVIGFLKQLLDKLEMIQDSTLENCNQIKEVFSGPLMPPQFEVINNSGCSIKLDLIQATEASMFNNMSLKNTNSLNPNRNLIYFAGGIALALFINDFMRDKRIVFNASF